MRKLLSLTTCFATLACGMAHAQNAPVRNTLQAVGGVVDRTTDAAATAARGAAAVTDRTAGSAVRGTAAAVDRSAAAAARTVRGAANLADRATGAAVLGTAKVVDRAADATARTVRGAVNAADRTTDVGGRVLGNTVQGTQQVLQNVGNELDPQMNYNTRYSDGYTQVQPLDQAWDQSTFSSQTAAVYTLHTDQSGREYICLGGQRTYVDNPNAIADSMLTPDQAQDERYRAAYGSYDSEMASTETASDQGTEETEQPAIETQQVTVPNDRTEQQAKRNAAKRAKKDSSDRRADNDGNSAFAKNDTEIESQDSGEIRLNSDTSSETKVGDSKVDAKADADVNTQDAPGLGLNTEIDAESKLDISE